MRVFNNLVGNYRKFNNLGTIHVKKDELEYLQFDILKEYSDYITHCFTTRKGGVSSGECFSLNLGFSRNDSRENVEENIKRVCTAMNIKTENLVFSNQIHSNKIRVVDEKDKGKGIVKESDIIGYDGLVTNKRNVALVTFYADCVPVFLFDPQNVVIALAHSGWRSTLKEIAGEIVKTMVSIYGSNPCDIKTVIGPSIGQCCFEVGNEVKEEFISKLSWSSIYCESSEVGKTNINLQGIIRQTLLNAGIKRENTYISNICTKCNNDIFFSHRGDKGKTGSLAAIMQII